MSTRVLNRDNKGRFCSPTNSSIKSMSLLINNKEKSNDEAALIHLLDSFYQNNVKFVENMFNSYTNNQKRKRSIKYKFNQPLINFTVFWEIV